MRKYLVYPFDYKGYNDKLDRYLEHSYNTRDRIVRLANFMIDEFPKIDYFWGGGHHFRYQDFLGINKKLGKMMSILDIGNDEQALGDCFPFSFDCSGFVTWCFINSFYSIDVFISDKNNYCLDTKDILKMGNLLRICKDNLLFIKKGDVAWMKGHVGIVTDIEDDKLVIVHVSLSGCGINRTTIDTNTCLIIDDDVGLMRSKDKSKRVGLKYFTHIVSIDYMDN